MTETVDVDGIPMTLVDTAGVHAGAVDPVEVEGIARAVAARDVAHVVLVVLDRSRPLDDDDRALLEATPIGRRVVVANKERSRAGVADGEVDVARPSRFRRRPVRVSTSARRAA